jgi:hypothetical protein
MDRLEELAAIEDAVTREVVRAGAIDSEVALLVPLDGVTVSDTGEVHGADRAALAHRKAHGQLYRGFEQMNRRELYQAEEQFLEPSRSLAQPTPGRFKQLDAARLTALELVELEKTLTSAGGGGSYDASMLQAALARQKREDAVS